MASPLLQQGRPILIAHRGWSTRFPENSLPALAAAFAAHADELEFDVRISADGTAVVCHDETLDRTSDLKGPVHIVHDEDLRAASIRMPDGSLLPGLGIPTAEEVLALLGHLVILNMHVKEALDAPAALEFLGRRCAAPGMKRHYVAGSVELLEEATRICPQVPRCLVSTPTEPLDMLIQNALRLGCERVQFFFGNCNREAVQEVRSSGLVAQYFFADDEDTARCILQLQMDALLTNDIGVLRPRLIQCAPGTLP